MNREIEIPQKNTRTEILTHLLEEDQTALDLKEKVGINENAVRKHLQRLENSELVQHYFEKASRGRPKKYFTLAERGEELFPRHHLLLLNELLEQIDEEHGKEELEHLFERVSEELKENFTFTENSSFEKRIEELTHQFDELDFFCQHSKKNDHHELEYQNCIFSGVSEKYIDLVCGIHEDMITSSFEEDIDFERDGSILRGDSTCRHVIKR